MFLWCTLIESSGAHASQLRLRIIQGVCEGSGEEIPLDRVTARIKNAPGVSRTTGSNGLIAVLLPANVTNGATIRIEVSRGPEPYEIVWPAAGKLLVEEVDNKQPLTVIVQRRGEKTSMCSPQIQRLIMQGVIERTPPNSAVGAGYGPALKGVADDFGIRADDVQNIYRHYKPESVDRYWLGIFDLWTKNWASAVQNFESSRTYRRDSYLNGHGSNKKDVADAAFFLGYSNFELKHFDKAYDAFSESIQYGNKTPEVLIDYAISLDKADQDAAKAYEDALASTVGRDDLSKLYRATMLFYYAAYKNTQGASEPKLEAAQTILHEAQKMLLEAAQTYEETPGCQSELTSTYMELAFPMQPGGKLQSSRAEEYLRKAVGLTQSRGNEVLHFEAESRLADYLRAAIVFKHSGQDLKEAEALFRDACANITISDFLPHASCGLGYGKLLFLM